MTSNVMMHPRWAGAAQKFKSPSCGMSDVAAFVAQERQMLSVTISTTNWQLTVPACFDNLNNNFNSVTMNVPKFMMVYDPLQLISKGFLSISSNFEDFVRKKTRVLYNSM